MKIGARLSAARRGAVRTSRLPNELVEYQGSAPCIPVWKTGVYLSTPMLEEEMQKDACRMQKTELSREARKPNFRLRLTDF